ncbi:unnamed protein product [Dibothriocephalus latus]|uniref:Uncharacterized protein n=1 Tax=Dibothriocephalus latus TaxID=60516 RepID=A0A3P6T7U0_DIBLA|nr:unnamed protein product [Dibothriocephalus latus]
MLLLLFFAALSCIYAYDKEYESCCVKNEHECEIAYKVLDRVLNHIILTGECIYLRNNTLRIKVNNDGVQNLPTGPYECIPEDGSSETRKKLFLFDKPDASIAISFDPPLPEQHFSRGNYTALLSLTINQNDAIFEKWLRSTKDRKSRSKIEIHQGKDWRIEPVKEGHEGHVQIVAMYEHPFMNLDPSNTTMKLRPGFYGAKVIRVTKMEAGIVHKILHYHVGSCVMSSELSNGACSFVMEAVGGLNGVGSIPNFIAVHVVASEIFSSHYK